MARKYETIVVFSPDLDEGKVKDESKKIEALLGSLGGSNIVIDSWGKKTIAYHVGKHKFGNYVCFKYESEKGDIITTVTNTLRITDLVIKFQNHRIADKTRKFKGNPRRVGTYDSSDDLGDMGEVDY